MADQVTAAAVESKRAEVDSLVRRLAEACREEVGLNARLKLEIALGDMEQPSLPLTEKESRK